MRVRKWIQITAIGVAVFWPWLGSPFQYVHWGDRFRTSIPIALIFGEPCTTRKGGIIHHGSGSECYRYDHPRIFKGIWLDEFEGSSFYEGYTSLPANYFDKQEAWLDFSKKALAESNIKAPGRGPTTVVEIEFLGRRTAHSGAHGHYGMWSHDIIVDKLITYRSIGAPIIR